MCDDMVILVFEKFSCVGEAWDQLLHVVLPLTLVAPRRICRAASACFVVIMLITTSSADLFLNSLWL